MALAWPASSAQVDVVQHPVAVIGVTLAGRCSRFPNALGVCGGDRLRARNPESQVERSRSSAAPPHLRRPSPVRPPTGRQTSPYLVGKLRQHRSVRGERFGEARLGVTTAGFAARAFNRISARAAHPSPALRRSPSSAAVKAAHRREGQRRLSGGGRVSLCDQCRPDARLTLEVRRARSFWGNRMEGAFRSFHAVGHDIAGGKRQRAGEHGACRSPTASRPAIRVSLECLASGGRCMRGRGVRSSGTAWNPQSITRSLADDTAGGVVGLTLGAIERIAQLDAGRGRSDHLRPRRLLNHMRQLVCEERSRPCSVPGEYMPSPNTMSRPTV